MQKASKCEHIFNILLILWLQCLESAQINKILLNSLFSIQELNLNLNNYSIKLTKQ